MHLATTNRGGNPVIHPVWYHFENERLYVFTERNALKSRNVDRTHEAYFSVDTAQDPLRGVKGKARAGFLSDLSESVRIAKTIIQKYTGESDSPFSKSVADRLKSGEDVVIELQPLYYSTWDYGKMQQS
jgi:nitroimidazol reductase NimA-like FMN-containing flavoprotein (pyridoxamine 5'-phosphate oxidase superfamily)